VIEKVRLPFGDIRFSAALNQYGTLRGSIHASGNEV
jgi:hypothetical protein